MNQKKSIIPKRWKYELPYEILNDLSLKKLRNLKEIPEKLSIDGKSPAGHWRAKFKRLYQKLRKNLTQLCEFI